MKEKDILLMQWYYCVKRSSGRKVSSACGEVKIAPRAAEGFAESCTYLPSPLSTKQEPMENVTLWQEENQFW